MEVISWWLARESITLVEWGGGPFPVFDVSCILYREISRWKGFEVGDPPALENIEKKIKGQPRQFALSKLVQAWYKSDNAPTNKICRRAPLAWP